MHTHRLLRAALVLTALTAAASGYAQTPPPGRLLASNCFQCHGTNGKGPGFDTLAGKSATKIYGELKEMQAKDKGIMSKHAWGYSDAQLMALSTWLSTQR